MNIAVKGGIGKRDDAVVQLLRDSGHSVITLGASVRLAIALLLALLGVVFGGVVVGQTANAAEPPVPEDVAAYFATGLVPRLADLYGAGKGTDAAFDETTKVGTIRRLLAWTPDFLAGKKTDAPTELTNTWIAPVTSKSGTILGLAAVWINPGSSVVELADFSRGRALVDALGRAPQDTLLIDDTAKQAWFATDGKTLTPLVVGKSKTTAPLTPAEYQKILRANATPTAPSQSATNPGLLIAGITLGAVVLLLAVFILLPGRKRRNNVPLAEPVEARAPALSFAEPVEALAPAPSPAEPVEATPTAARPKRPFEPDPEPVVSSTKPRDTASAKKTQLKSAPGRKAPVKVVPRTAAPQKTVSTESVPADTASTQAEPTRPAPTKAAPKKPAQAKSAPKKKAPAVRPPAAKE